jgi:hypothetical protein
MPEALVKWREERETFRRQAIDWARSMLEEHFATEDAYKPRTAGELCQWLDDHPAQPRGWSMLVEKDTASYRERYGHVRNILEVLARQRVVAMGTTVNAKGNPKATTYARPHDATSEWDISLEGSPDAVARARQGIREWLSLDGSVLDGVTGVIFTRRGAGKAPRAQGGAYGSRSKTEVAAGGQQIRTPRHSRRFKVVDR